MEKQKKGVRLEHISKIYNDPKTGKVFMEHSDGTKVEVGETRRGRYSERRR